MDLLCIDACPRGRGESRTLLLLDAFLNAHGAARPDADIRVHDVCGMGLLPLDGPQLRAREALIDARDFAHPLFSPARDFVRARSVVVAAPYWDLSFPAALKTYIECIFIREKTFRYVDDAPVGLCAARRALFLTTAGGIIGAQDFGAQYLKATFHMLGIPRFDCVCADGLDMAGADARGKLARAKEQAEALARGWEA